MSCGLGRSEAQAVRELADRADRAGLGAAETVGWQNKRSEGDGSPTRLLTPPWKLAVSADGGVRIHDGINDGESNVAEHMSDRFFSFNGGPHVAEHTSDGGLADVSTSVAAGGALEGSPRDVMGHSRSRDNCVHKLDAFQNPTQNASDAEIETDEVLARISNDDPVESKGPSILVMPPTLDEPPKQEDSQFSQCSQGGERRVGASKRPREGGGETELPGHTLRTVARALSGRVGTLVTARRRVRRAGANKRPREG